MLKESVNFLFLSKKITKDSNFLSLPEIMPTQNNGKPNAPFMDKFALVREFMKTRSLVLEKKVGSSNGMQFVEIMDYFAFFNLLISQL